MNGCADCNYVKNEFEVRQNYLNNKSEFDPDIAHSCFCDKLGGKCGWWGYCEDAKVTEEPGNEPKKVKDKKSKARLRRHHNKRYKFKLKRQSENLRFYPSPAYSVDKYGNYTNIPEEIVYYKETNKSSHSTRYSYCKQLSNRKVRQNNKKSIKLLDDYNIGNRGHYKKVYDYWWNVD